MFLDYAEATAKAVAKEKAARMYQDEVKREQAYHQIYWEEYLKLVTPPNQPTQMDRIELLLTEIRDKLT